MPIAPGLDMLIPVVPAVLWLALWIWDRLQSKR